MKRWPPVLRTILIFLLLGSILNVAVAWGIANRWSPNFFPDDPIEHASEQLRILHQHLYPENFISDGRSSTQWSSFGVHSTAITTNVVRVIREGREYSAYPVEYDDGRDHYIFSTLIHKSGWPMYTLWSYSTLEGDPTVTRGGGPNGFDYGNLHFIYLTHWGHNNSEIYWLPYFPIWMGIIFNTIFYAVILWFLIVGPFILRRHRRIRRGRCGQCGYIVAPNIGVPGASPNCTECGTPIPPGIGSRT